jgi:hypothetical protein
MLEVGFITLVKPIAMLSIFVLIMQLQIIVMFFEAFSML